MKNKELFVRPKSGLVRVLSVHDALIFNIVCIAFFSGSIYAFQMTSYLAPGANVSLTFLLTILFTLPLYLSWAMLASSFPRSGGDYVFTSRLVLPSLAFAATFSAWIFWQLWYNACFPIQIIWQSISPFLVMMGNTAASDWVLSHTGMLVVGIGLLFLALLAAIPGMSFYAKLQRILFAFTIVSIILLLWVLAITNPASFAERFNSFMAATTGNKIDWYNQVINVAKEAGYVPAPFSWYDTLKLIPVAMMCMGYGFWSIMIMGEIKGAKETKLAVYSIYGSVIIMGLFFAALYALLQNSGSLFYNSLFYLYMKGDPFISQIPFWPNYMFIAAVASPNLLCTYLIQLGAAANVFNLMVMMYIVGARVMFAQTFDRIWPEKLSYLGTRYISPIYALIVYFIGSVIWLIPAVFYPEIYFYFTAVVLGVLLAYVLTGIAGITFPIRMKDAYEASPIAKYKIMGVPLIQISGIAALAFCGFLLYWYLTVPELGLMNPISVSIVLIVYVVSLVYFYIIRWYRAKYQGINIDLAFKNIPPE